MLQLVVVSQAVLQILIIWIPTKTFIIAKPGVGFFAAGGGACEQKEFIGNRNHNFSEMIAFVGGVVGGGGSAATGAASSSTILSFSPSVSSVFTSVGFSASATSMTSYTNLIKYCQVPPAARVGAGAEGGGGLGSAFAASDVVLEGDESNGFSGGPVGGAFVGGAVAGGAFKGGADVGGGPAGGFVDGSVHKR